MVPPFLRLVPKTPLPSERGRDETRTVDQDLARAVAAGEPAAMRALTQRCLPRVMGVAVRLLKDREDAQDVAQETFLKVWRNIGRFDANRAKLETWVTKIAVNASYDRLRKKRETLLGDDMPEQIDGAPSAEAQLTASDASRRVQQAIQALPERQRLALELCHFQERTNIEAAQIMDVSVEAMESLLARARRTLKTTLASEREELLADAAQLQGQEP